MDTDIDKLKEAAARAAVEQVTSGMVIGLGHGSTTRFALLRLAELIRLEQLEKIKGVACSRQVEEEADRMGIPLTSLQEHPVIDLTIDGADEVDSELNLIKGGGGALLREKIVAQASRREIIIIDEEKLSPQLGHKWAVPVEVIEYGWGNQVEYLKSLGARVQLRIAGGQDPFYTDQGNLILDCNFGPIPDPDSLAVKIKSRTGVVEHGLFIGLASEVIVAGRQGLRHLTR